MRHHPLKPCLACSAPSRAGCWTGNTLLGLPPEEGCPVSTTPCIACMSFTLLEACILVLALFFFSFFASFVPFFQDSGADPIGRAMKCGWVLIQSMNAVDGSAVSTQGSAVTASI